MVNAFRFTGNSIHIHPKGLYTSRKEQQTVCISFILEDILYYS